MSAVTRNEVISFTAGSLYGESPLCIEDAVAAALRLVDEFDDHGWLVVADERGGDESDIKIEFDAGVVPTWLSIAGTVYDVVPRTSPAEELAERFDEVESASPPVAEPEVDTSNDMLVAIRTGDSSIAIQALGPMAIERDKALRMAAWIVSLADPLGDDFARVLKAVQST